MSAHGAQSWQHLPEPLAQAIEAAKVPPLPEALLRLLQMAEDDTKTMAELATVVEQDPGLCARILTAANSPGLRRGTPLHSVTNCLTSLGTRLIRSIATCLSLQSMFERRHETFRTDLVQFWRHSLQVAEAARDLATATAFPHPEEAYLAGLMHDIGELVLLSALGGNYAQTLTLANDELHLCVLETEHFGVNHAEIGTWMVDHWESRLAISDGILFHHAKADEIVTAGTLPQIVWIAHALATADEVSEATLRVARESFGDTLANKLEPIRRQARERMEQIGEAMGLVEANPPTASRNNLPQVAVATPALTAGNAHQEIEAIMRDMALLQPLQRDLFGIDSDTELLLSLRESARILFDLSHMAFFLRDADDRLSAARFGDQPVLFRHAVIRADAPRCLVAAAATRQRIVSSFDDDYAQPAALIDIQFARVFGTQGLLCVPLCGRASTIGVMVFGLSSGQHGRLNRRLPWILNFGRIAALSIEAWREAIDYRKRADDEASARFERQARRVVHEAGNPLGIIKGYLKVLDNKLPTDISVRDELSVLREEIDRVASIVRRLKEIPHTAEAGGGTDVPTLVRELLAFYDASLFKPRQIEVVVVSDDVGDVALCDRDSLKQVLLNLWKNASEAMSAGSRLEIGISDGVIQNGRKHVELVISDNGPGMSPETVARLFSPDSGTGSGDRGMGLSIVGALVTQMGASINCRSRLGSGTTFTLMLPCK